MKREFLQNLQGLDAPLSKEAIDAIMAENGRDIQKAKAAFADYEELKTRLEDAESKLQHAAQQEDWQEKYLALESSHSQQLRQVVFEKHLDKALLASHARNHKAVAALLDLDALKESEDQPAAIEQALETLKQDCGYLFDSEVPPPYARGTGAASAKEEKTPASLAGALREKFERK